MPWGELASVGPWGLVTIFVLMVFSGFLVRSTQAKEWKDLYLRERASREDMQDVMGLLRKVLKALPPRMTEDE